jgi:hypothetical protein
MRALLGGLLLLAASGRAAETSDVHERLRAFAEP